MINFGASNGILTINLKALSDNYKLLQTYVGTNCSVAGVVKANAYGLGLEQIAATIKDLGCKQFFVATLDEAIKLRATNSEISIAVLGGLMNGEEKEYINNNITPVINTPDDINRWHSLASKLDRKLTTIIHIDTGMNRLGLDTAETRTIIEGKTILNSLNVHYIMSHFACADDKEHQLTQRQADNFANITKHFLHSKKSLANSSGLFRHNSYHYDMVRPGYALYGGNPTPETSNPMKPVISLNTRILQIRTCKKGDSIGYSATHVFDKTTRTATIALGYADGFFRSNSSKAILYYNDHPCEVLGRVSMDLVSIDISNIKEKPPEQGDSIEILGKNQTIDELANTANTIGYEILTSLGARYKRAYI